MQMILIRTGHQNVSTLLLYLPITNSPKSASIIVTFCRYFEGSGRIIVVEEMKEGSGRIVVEDKCKRRALDSL